MQQHPNDAISQTTQRRYPGSIQYSSTAHHSDFQNLMTSFSEALLWMSVIFPLVFSAGPGNVLCAVAGATNGFKQSIPFILGLDCVYTSYALLAGFGMATVFEAYPQAFVPVQVLGAVYVAWLGFKFLKRRSLKAGQPTKLLLS